jgi:hypothetical protein
VMLRCSESSTRLLRDTDERGLGFIGGWVGWSGRRRGHRSRAAEDGREKGAEESLKMDWWRVSNKNVDCTWFICSNECSMWDRRYLLQKIQLEWLNSASCVLKRQVSKLVDKRTEIHLRSGKKHRFFYTSLY